MKSVFLLFALALVQACANLGPAPMENVPWRLVELHSEPVGATEGAETPSLRFDAASKTVTGTTGVNRFNGGYVLEGEALRFGVLATTRRAGPPEQMQLETRFLQALDRTRSAVIAEGSLELREGGEVLARLTTD
jgi:putative lipoprotein